MKILRREKSVDGIKFILFEKHVNATIATIPTSISEVTNIVQQQENFDREQYTTLDVVRSEISSSLKNFNVISSPNQFQFPTSQPKDNDIIQFDGSLGEIKWSELPSVKNYEVDIQSINNTFAEHKFNFDSSYIKTRTIHFKFDGYSRDNGLQWQDHDKPLEGYYGIMMGRGPDFSFSGQATRGGLVGVSNSLVMRSSMSEGTNRGFLWTRTGGESPGYYPLMALSTSNAMLHIDGGISILRNAAWTSNETLSAITNMPHLNIFLSGLTATEQDYVVVYKHTIPLSGTDYLNRGLVLIPQSELTGITGGPGTSELSGLTDVSLSALTNGHALTYNSATEKWQNATPSEGVTDHELLTGLSGGSANDHYHLSLLAYSALTSGATSNASSYHLHGDSYVTPGDLSILLPGFSEVDHTHAFSAYSGLAGTAHTHTLADISSSAHTHAYSAITNTAHTHAYALPTHTHFFTDITDQMLPSKISIETGLEFPDPTVYPEGYMLMSDGAVGGGWYPQSSIDHGSLGGLNDNDHPRYSQTSHTHSTLYSPLAHTHPYSAITETGHTHGLSAMTGTVNWNQIYSAGTIFGDTLISYGDSVAPYGWQSYNIITALLSKSDTGHTHPFSAITNTAHTHTFSAITDSGTTLETWLSGQGHTRFSANSVSATTLSSTTIEMGNFATIVSSGQGQVKLANKRGFATGAGSGNTLNVDLGQNWQYGVTFSSTGSGGNTIRFANTCLIGDSTNFAFGDQSSTYLRFYNGTNWTGGSADGGALQLVTAVSGADDCSGLIEVVGKGNMRTGYYRPNYDDPHFRIWSNSTSDSATTQNQFGEFYHDRTRFVVNVGSGSLVLSGVSGTQIGNSPNYVNITSAGTLTLVGSAKTWDDLRVEPVVKATGTNDPTFTQWFNSGSSRGVYLYNFTNVIEAQEKEVFFTVQLPHTWAGTPIYPHVHFVPASDGLEGNEDRAIWGLEYTWADIGEVFGNTTLIYTTGSHSPNDFDYVAYKHYVDPFSMINTASTTNGISSILICRLWRDSGNINDTYPDTCGLLYVDFHYEVDSLGSNEEYVK